jgi:hypothetical protein
MRAGRVGQVGPDGVIAVSGGQVKAISAVLRDQISAAPRGAVKWDNPLFWNIESDPAERCQFLAVGNCLNFRFWTKPGEEIVPSEGLVDGRLFRGAMYMWRRLRRAVAEGDLSLEADRLASLTEEQFCRAFADDDGLQPLAPGMADRVANLRDLGTRLSQAWNGQFINVITASGVSLERFAELSSQFRAFDDPVRKLTMVNAIMLTGSQLARFDQEPLPGVDYHLVKQALRQGLVVPSGRIRSKLASREYLEAGESQALRAAVLAAVVEVATLAGISTAVIDNLYWLNRAICGQERWQCESCPFRAACPQLTQFGMPLELTRYY